MRNEMLNFPSDCCPSISLSRRKEKFPFPNLICDYFDCVTPRPARKTGTPFSRQILNPSSGRRRLRSPFLLLISYEQKKKLCPPSSSFSPRFPLETSRTFFHKGAKSAKEVMSEWKKFEERSRSRAGEDQSRRDDWTEGESLILLCCIMTFQTFARSFPVAR